MTAPAAKLDCAPYARGLFIGGQWQSGRGIPVVNPSDESILAEVPDATVSEALAAVEIGRAHV